MVVSASPVPLPRQNFDFLRPSSAANGLCAHINLSHCDAASAPRCISVAFRAHATPTRKPPRWGVSTYYIRTPGEGAQSGAAKLVRPRIPARVPASPPSRPCPRPCIPLRASSRPAPNRPIIIRSIPSPRAGLGDAKNVYLRRCAAKNSRSSSRRSRKYTISHFRRGHK